MITSHSLGHLIYFDGNVWRYADNHEEVTVERFCIRCKQKPTKEGYDHCLGHIEGATSACCGHGVEKPYIVKHEKGIFLDTRNET